MNINSDAEAIAKKVDIPADIAQPMVNDLDYLLNDGNTTVDEAETFLKEHYADQLRAGVQWDEIIECYISNQHNTPENLL